jgi:hypothetical protein
MSTLIEMMTFPPAPAEPILIAGDPRDRAANAANAAALDRYAVDYAAWKAAREAAARTRAEQLKFSFGLLKEPRWYFWRGYICFVTDEQVYEDEDEGEPHPWDE